MSKKNKNGMKEERLNGIILGIVDGLPTMAANRVIEAFNEMPYVVRDALEDFYNAMEGVDVEDGVEKVREALVNLQKMCEANPEYKRIYGAAKEEANQGLAELYANGMMSI